MDQIYDELYDSRIECPIGNKWYIPLDVLCQIITPEKVLKTEQPWPDHDSGVEYIVTRAMKTFATLVLAGRSNPIRDILINDLTDDHLPLAPERENERHSLVSLQGNGQTFKLLDGWRKPEVSNFLEKQWLFQAPVFDTYGHHLNLNRECPLPFRPPIEHIGSTPSSRVFTCEVHPAHYRNELQGYQVAIKVIETEKTFQLEKKNLAAIQGLNNPHLIKHIVTYQRDMVYYVVFPLANGGSLLSFWEQKNEFPRSGELILWALQQMLGLADATRALHYGFQGQIHCRHGDLKPANILHFEGDKGSSLVIADLGVSSIHDKPTNQRLGATMTKATTLSYEAPEAYDDESKKRPRSRTYDIWSLGCVFLEFTIWLLYNFNAIKNFEHNRHDRHQNPDASFYELRDGKAVVPQTVEDAVKALKDDSRLRDNSALKALVNLISEKLLVPVVKDRFNAQELHTTLQRIVQRAEEFSPYPANEADSPSFIPNIFRPPGDHNT
ncbi:kinase-like domain-containing protein [Hypoxylon argillaceum]|nr:kinase-like domain-containing protein [Hypoxylon argillaceum]